MYRGYKYVFSQAGEISQIDLQHQKGQAADMPSQLQDNAEELSKPGENLPNTAEEATEEIQDPKLEEKTKKLWDLDTLRAARDWALTNFGDIGKKAWQKLIVQMPAHVIANLNSFYQIDAEVDENPDLAGLRGGNAAAVEQNVETGPVGRALRNLIERVRFEQNNMQSAVPVVAFNLYKFKKAQGIPDQTVSRFPVTSFDDFKRKFLEDLLQWEGKYGKNAEGMGLEEDVLDTKTSNDAANEIVAALGDSPEDKVIEVLRRIQTANPLEDRPMIEELMSWIYEEQLPDVVKQEQPVMSDKEPKGIIKFNLSDHVLNNKVAGLDKTASAFQSQEYVLYGPTEKRICPKLRGKNIGSDVVSEYICRHHCLDGIVIDDNKTVCGEALWRGNVMDKFSREYVNEEGRPEGGYINKRFEVNRPQEIPEENRIRLKPGETRIPRSPATRGNYEARMQDMRQKEADKREYRPDSNKGDAFVWCTDVDQNNVNVSQGERDRREEAMGHKTVQYTNKDKQENNPKTAFNLKQYKDAQMKMPPKSMLDEEDMFGDDPENPGQCDMCGGQLLILGQLGNLMHLQCRQCGMEFNRSSQEEGTKDFAVQVGGPVVSSTKFNLHEYKTAQKKK